MATALLTAAEVARRLQCHPHTARRWIWDHRLRAVKVGGVVRVPEDEVERFVRPLPAVGTARTTGAGPGAVALRGVMRGLRKSVTRADVLALERCIAKAEQPADEITPLA